VRAVGKQLRSRQPFKEPTSLPPGNRLAALSSPAVSNVINRLPVARARGVVSTVEVDRAFDIGLWFSILI
jgi:hypothetical protein